MLRPLVVDGSGDVPSLCLCGGEVNHYGPLYLEHGLAIMQFGQLGIDGRSLDGEFASPL
jgi:hypothetical protein